MAYESLRLMRTGEKKKNNVLVFSKEKLHYDSFSIIPSSTTGCIMGTGTWKESDDKHLISNSVQMYP